MYKNKKELIENLKSCFPNDELVHISDIAQWIGKKTAIYARKYSDKDGFIKIR